MLNTKRQGLDQKETHDTMLKEWTLSLILPYKIGL